MRTLKLHPPDNEHLVFSSEATFFSIVQTTYDLTEALRLVKDARHAVLREKARLSGGAEDQALAALLQRLNDEVHELSEANDRTKMSKAIRAICDETTAQRIFEYHSQLVADYRRERDQHRGK